MELHWQIIIIYILISLGSFVSVHSLLLPSNPIANLSTTWINNVDSINFAFIDEVMKVILFRPTPTPNLFYAFGFFNNGFSSSYLLSVAIVKPQNLRDLTSTSGYETYIVWSANRNKPIKIGATFQLTSDGNLLLTDAGGDLVWSTNNTAGRSVAGMNLTEAGNFLLFDANNSVVWQSFDHPTDCLLPGQTIRPGNRLTASVSETNCSQGLYSYTSENDDVYLYVGQELVYYHHRRNISPENGSFIQLGWDGHLRQFHLDLLEGELSNCQYPMVCGEYGVCQNGQCSSPESSNIVLSSYFRPS